MTWLARPSGVVAAALVAAGLFFTTSGAYAADFMSEGNVNVSVQGAQSTTNVFTIEGNNASCPTASLQTAGLIASPASGVTMHPTYSGNCSVFGFINGSITTTGCDYELFAGGSLSGGKAPAQLEIDCAAGKKIVIVGGTCEVTIEPNQPLTNATVENLATSPKTVNLLFDATGVDAFKVKDGFLCPLNGTGAANGEYAGKSLLKGFSSGGTQIGITYE